MQENALISNAFTKASVPPLSPLSTEDPAMLHSAQTDQEAEDWT